MCRQNPVAALTLNVPPSRMIPTPASPMVGAYPTAAPDRPFRPGRPAGARPATAKPANIDPRGTAFKVLIHHLTATLRPDAEGSRNTAWCLLAACAVAKAPGVAAKRLGLAAADSTCADVCAALLACVASQQLPSFSTTTTASRKEDASARRRKLRQCASLVAAVLRIVDAQVALPFVFDLPVTPGDANKAIQTQPKPASPTSVAELTSRRPSPQAPPDAAAAAPAPTPLEQMTVEIPPAAVAEFVPVYPPTASPLATPLPSPSASLLSSSRNHGAPEESAPDLVMEAGTATEAGGETEASPLPVAQLLHFDQEADADPDAPGAGGGAGRRLRVRGCDDGVDDNDIESKTAVAAPVVSPSAAAADSTGTTVTVSSPRWQLMLLAVLLVALGASLGTLAGRSTATITTLPPTVPPPLAMGVAGGVEVNALVVVSREVVPARGLEEAVSAWLEENEDGDDAAAHMEGEGEAVEEEDGVDGEEEEVLEGVASVLDVAETAAAEEAPPAVPPPPALPALAEAEAEATATAAVPVDASTVATGLLPAEPDGAPAEGGPAARLLRWLQEADWGLHHLHSEA